MKTQFSSAGFSIKTLSGRNQFLPASGWIFSDIFNAPGKKKSFPRLTTKWPGKFNNSPSPSELKTFRIA